METCIYCGSRNRNVDQCTQCGAPLPIVPVRDKGVTVNVKINADALKVMIKVNSELNKTMSKRMAMQDAIRAGDARALAQIRNWP